MDDCAWPAGAPLPRTPDLDDDAVHIWCTSLDQPPIAQPDLLRVLTPDERAAAERYIRPVDRARASVSRGLLRWLLGAYLGLEPAAITLVTGAFGKPQLAAPRRGRALSFNVSHADDVLLIALARAPHVGVDVERVRPLPDRDRIAARYFATPEQVALRGVPPPAADQAFFVCWTRKEALVKAHGSGLTLPLDSFEVALEPAVGPAALHIPASPGEGSRWSLIGLRPAEDCVGALAVDQPHVRVEAWRWIDRAI